MKEKNTYDSEHIDVSEIMKQIEKEAAEMPKPDFQKADQIMLQIPINRNSSMETRIQTLAKKASVNPWFQITGNPITKLLKKVIRKCIYWILGPPFEKQTTYNRDAVNLFTVQQMMIGELSGKLEVLQDQVDLFQEMTNQYRTYFDVKLEEHRTYINTTLEEYIKKEYFENAEDNLATRMENIENRHTKILNETIETIRGSEEFQKMQHTISAINHRLWRAENAKLLPNQENREFAAIASSISEEERPLEFDYFLFEEQYRGSQESIAARQDFYLPYFVEKQNILDIGCGRGEFLKALSNKHISAKGIDLSDDMVDYCKHIGLSVEKADVVEYLNTQEDNSLGGVFSAQVIEHLSIYTIIDMVKLAYQKLAPGACFIAETLNPQSLIVFTEAYFLDPTHVKMIHPYTIKFILESEGFHNVEILYLSDVDDTMKIPRLASFSEAEQNQANRSIDILNGLLYGPRDFAIVGRK